MTTTYKIIDLTVVQTIAHADGSISSNYHGPYKNDESAKRRIRDLKRKDKEADANVALSATAKKTCAFLQSKEFVHWRNDRRSGRKAAKPHTPGPIVIETTFGIASDLRQPIAEIRATPIAGPINFDPLAAGMNNLDMSKFKIERPRGVYPAISKHAYRR